jgi:hypothetical protein
MCNTVLALCVLDNKVYRYTFIILNVYGFTTATIVMQMHLSGMCIHMMSVLLYMSADSCTGQWLIVMLLSYYTLPSDKEKNV